jgi:hypothetical protein
MLLELRLHGGIDHDLDQLPQDVEAFAANSLQLLGW